MDDNNPKKRTTLLKKGRLIVNDRTACLVLHLVLAVQITSIYVERFKIIYLRL